MSDFVDTQAPLQEQNHDDKAYIDAMVAKAKAARGEGSEEETTTPETSEAEKLLAGKYKSEDDLNKGILELIKRNNPDLEAYYKELEKGLGKPKAEQPTQDNLQVPEAPEAAEAVEKAGLDLNVLFEEYAQTGAIKEESYTALDKIGITRDVVDGYIAGQEALAEKRAVKVYEEAGGQESYQAMLEWASENMSQSEKDLFNNTVISTDIDQVMFAVNGLKAKYTQAVGNPPKQLLQGSTPTGGDTFGSRAELVAAMSDSRYEKDSAYRNSIYAKLQRSNLFNHR